MTILGEKNSWRGPESSLLNRMFESTRNQEIKSGGNYVTKSFVVGTLLFSVTVNESEVIKKGVLAIRKGRKIFTSMPSC